MWCLGVDIGCLAVCMYFAISMHGMCGEIRMMWEELHRILKVQDNVREEDQEDKL
jgi:hypothetical protein